MPLNIELLGGLQVTDGDAPVDLPASRKTRALLAYLALSDRPRRREHLCEMLWDGPDDPRGLLRWCVSKLRGVLDRGGVVRVLADRHQVALDLSADSVDLHRIRGLLHTPDEAVDTQTLIDAAEALRRPLLDGLDQPAHPAFEAWLVAQRETTRALRSRLLAKLLSASELSGRQALPWIREWLEVDPADPAAHAALEATLAALRDGAVKADGLTSQPVSQAGLSDGLATGKAWLQRQRLKFCAASDGVRIAYARVGEGPPLVKAANWLSHLELDWESPAWSPLFQELARDHSFIRYDERGNGLSDWAVEDLSFEAFVRDLETVVDASGVDRFPLLGISQGGAVAIAYAARFPERVSHLILCGAYASGWRVDGGADLIAEREAVITLVRHGWGRDDPAYRQIFSQGFMPSATAAEIGWFNDFQRRTASPENAARFLDVFSRIDVRALLKQVTAPTLVLHARDDRRIPVARGVEIATEIPNAEFIALDTDNHLLLGREPASAAFVGHVRAFLADQGEVPALVR
jgi:pimeloyl-ACP methyl ester carboxylesterase/DNA-binding SARP family transcriptional activator